MIVREGTKRLNIALLTEGSKLFFSVFDIILNSLRQSCIFPCSSDTFPLRNGFCGQVYENLHDGSLGPPNVQNSLIRDFRAMHQAHSVTENGKIC